MFGFVQKPFFLELEFILSKIFVPLVRDFQMFQKLTSRLPFCFVLRRPHSMRTFATFISVGIARIADRGSWIADRAFGIADRAFGIADRTRIADRGTSGIAEKLRHWGFLLGHMWRKKKCLVLHKIENIVFQYFLKQTLLNTKYCSLFDHKW